MLLDHVVEHDVRESLLLLAGEQPAEDRIAVEARKAPPHDPGGRIDQRGGAAVAEDGEIEPVIRQGVAAASSLEIRSSQLRTSRGLSKQPAAPGNLRPTEKPTPPISGRTANTLSSVTSSPTNSGRLPANGGCRISARTPVAFSKPRRLISITALPGSTSIVPAGAAAQAAANPASIAPARTAGCFFEPGSFVLDPGLPGRPLVRAGGPRRAARGTRSLDRVLEGRREP